MESQPPEASEPFSINPSSGGFHNRTEYPCGNAFKITVSGSVLYDRDTGEISRFATLADLIADQSFAGAEPIAPIDFESLASDGATWVLFDTDTDEISRYASLADLIAGDDIAGLEAIVPAGFEGIASDGSTWVLYNSNNEKIARYASLADLIAGNDIAGLESIVPTGFEEIASSGGIWVLPPRAGSLLDRILGYRTLPKTQLQLPILGPSSVSDLTLLRTASTLLPFVSRSIVEIHACIDRPRGSHWQRPLSR